MDALKTALPSVTAPPPTLTAAAAAEAGNEKRSAGSEREIHEMIDSDPARALATATKGCSVSHPPRPTRPGQIGEGKGTPLSRSQRRRVLYVFFFLVAILDCCRGNLFFFPLKFCSPLVSATLLSYFFSFFWPAAQESRTFPPTIDTCKPRIFCKPVRDYSHARQEHPRSAAANKVNNISMDPWMILRVGFSYWHRFDHLPLWFHRLPARLRAITHTIP